MRIEDRDLVAIHVVRGAIKRLPWSTSVRVIFYVLRELWPNAYNHLMREECYRDKV